MYLFAFETGFSQHASALVRQHSSKASPDQKGCDLTSVLPFWSDSNGLGQRKKNVLTKEFQWQNSIRGFCINFYFVVFFILFILFVHSNEKNEQQRQTKTTVVCRGRHHQDLLGQGSQKTQRHGSPSRHQPVVVAIDPERLPGKQLYSYVV